MFTEHQDAISARSDWAARRREALDRIADELAALAIEDYQHQIGPRGCSERAAYREVADDLKGVTSLIDSAVRDRLMDYLFEQRRGDN